MKCNEVKNNLVDLATGKLESFEMMRHLEMCENCRAELNKISEVVHVLSNYKFEEPSEFYWQNFLARVKRRISNREGKVRVFALKPVFLAPSLVVVIIGFLFGIIFSNLPIKQEELYIAQLPDVEMTGVLVKPYELSGISDETIEQAVSYLYEKYQLPEIDFEKYNEQNFDVEEILKRISNKF